MTTTWTAEAIETLRRMYPDHSAAAIGKVLGRAPGSIYYKATKLGLEKSADFMASVSSGRIMRGKKSPAMQATQFKPGLTPWNKGKPGVTGLHPNCRPTQFKAGRSPEESRNYVPIGSLRINADGYLERKTTDDRGLMPARRWTAVHRLVWEAAHGPLAKGLIVVFKGPRTAVLEHITVDRLECITRAENARRNHPKNRSPEYARLVQLRGAITRQVNRIIEQHEEATA